MKIATIFTGVAFFAATVSGAWAGAVIEGSSTGVKAVSAKGMVAVAPGADVPAGTRLIVGRAAAGMKAANTELRFADGCAVSLEPGQVFTVGEASPCTFTAQGGPAPEDSSLLGGGTIAPVVIGTVVLGGIVAGVIAATSSKSNNARVPYLSF